MVGRRRSGAGICIHGGGAALLPEEVELLRHHGEAGGLREVQAALGDEVTGVEQVFKPAVEGQINCGQVFSTFIPYPPPPLV